MQNPQNPDGQMEDAGLYQIPDGLVPEDYHGVLVYRWYDPDYAGFGRQRGGYRFVLCADPAVFGAGCDELTASTGMLYALVQKEVSGAGETDDGKA